MGTEWGNACSNRDGSHRYHLPVALYHLPQADPPVGSATGLQLLAQPQLYSNLHGEGLFADVRPLVLQHHFVIFCLSSLVVGLFSSILVSPSPPRPAACRSQVRERSDHVCQEMLDFTECEWNEAAANTFGETAAVTAR